MAFHVNADYAPPKNWQQFEELCADTFAAHWSDPALQRHGRAGQAQHGVDIVARHGNQWPIGLQCRKKSPWPVASLTIEEVDEAVKEARGFIPPLRSFYILSTAPDDAKVQEHARLVTARHQAEGLFDVNVMGWSEILRRATLYTDVADKHFGSGGAAPRAPLLATWFASKGRLELAGEELSVTCRELVHDLRDFPAGRIVLRQRESDELVAQLAAYDGRQLTITERQARLELRDRLAVKEQKEVRISRGLGLLLGDPTVLPWDSGDAATAVTGLVNHELKDNPFIDPETIKMRVTCPHDKEIYRNRYLTRADVASITALQQKRDKKLGHGRHTNTVMELPDEVRGAEAIPAAIAAILHQLDEGRSLEEMRKQGILYLGDWRIDILY
ncbi:MAG TPA: hypothetical protein VFA89_20645 [Terriglobales bacterium]|nr:hypothetical protein [Terriglobales bacterium]